MNKKAAYLGGAAALVVGFLYYRKQQAAKAAANSGEYTSSSAIGSMFRPVTYTDASTGQQVTKTPYPSRMTGAQENYISNYRYGEYQQYLSSGGPNSGTDFTTYLTSQGQTLPTNT